MLACDSARPKKGKAFAVPLAKGESVKTKTAAQEQVTDREPKRVVATDVPADVTAKSRDGAEPPPDRDADCSSQPSVPAKKSKTKADSVAKSKLTDADYDEIFRAVIGSCRHETQAMDPDGETTQSKQAEPCRTSQAGSGSAPPAVADPLRLEAAQAGGFERPTPETGAPSQESDGDAQRKTPNSLEPSPAVPSAAAQPPPRGDVGVSESATAGGGVRSDRSFTEAQGTTPVAEAVRNVANICGAIAAEAGAPLCEAAPDDFDRQSRVAAPASEGGAAATAASAAALPPIDLATPAVVAATVPPSSPTRTSVQAGDESSSSGAAEGPVCKLVPYELDQPPPTAAQAPTAVATAAPSTAGVPAATSGVAVAQPARDVQALPTPNGGLSCGGTKGARPRASKTLKKGLSDREYGELFASVLKASREPTETADASQAGKKMKGPAGVAKSMKNLVTTGSHLRDEPENSDADSGEQLAAVGGDRCNIQNRSSAREEKKMSTTEETYREEPGVWVQCCKSTCGKWRFLPYVQDPSELADVRWDCSMNKDATYADCSMFEEKWQADGSYVYAKVTEGTLVVAKVTGYPWWPAMIEADPEEETYVHVLESNQFEPDEYHVVFFDKGKVTRAWIPATAVKLFKGHQPRDDEMAKLGSLYYERLKEAFHQAKVAASMSLTDRLEEYGFANRKQTRNRQRKTVTEISSYPREKASTRKVRRKKSSETSELNATGSIRTRSKKSRNREPAAEASNPDLPLKESVDKDTCSALDVSSAAVSMKGTNCSEDNNSACTPGVVINEQPDTALESTVQSGKLATSDGAGNDPAGSFKSALPRVPAGKKAKPGFVAPVVQSRPSASAGACQRPASDHLGEVASMAQTEGLKCPTAAHEIPDMACVTDRLVHATEDAEVRPSSGFSDDYGVNKECDSNSAKEPKPTFTSEKQTDVLAAPKVTDIGTGDNHDSDYIGVPINLRCDEESDPFEIEQPDQAMDLADRQACQKLCDGELPFQPEAKRRRVEPETQNLDIEESVAASGSKAVSRSAAFEESDPFEMDDSCESRGENDTGLPVHVSYEDVTPAPKDDGSDLFVIVAPDADDPAPWRILNDKQNNSDVNLQRLEE